MMTVLWFMISLLWFIYYFWNWWYGDHRCVCVQSFYVIRLNKSTSGLRIPSNLEKSEQATPTRSIDHSTIIELNFIQFFCYRTKWTQWSQSNGWSLHKWTTFAGFYATKNYWIGTFWNPTMWYFENTSGL